MRIVPNLNEIDECPNCGNDRCLRETENQFGRPYVVCLNCHEELYENEFTVDMEEARDHAFNVGKAPDAIDDTLMDIEYELGQLTLWAHDKHSLDQLEAIKSILEQFLSVIRRMK